MRKLLGVTLIAVSLLLTSCRLFDKEITDDSAVITKEYEVSNINCLQIKDIQIKQGGTYFGPSIYLKESNRSYVEVKTNELINKKIKVECVNNELKIYGKRLETYVTKNIEVYIYGCSFDKIKLSNVKIEADKTAFKNDNIDINLSGACKFNIEEINCNELDLDISGATNVNISMLNTSNLNIDMSGASKIEINNLKADNAKAYLSGASKLKLAGSTTKGEYYGSGASLFELKDCRSNDVKLDLSGASDAYVSFNNSLKGSISGSSEVIYYSDSNNVDISTSGGSDVKKG